MWEIFKHKSGNEEFGQQTKSLDFENRRQEHKLETLDDPNDVCEGIIALHSFSIRKKKIDQVIAVVRSKLAKRDIESFRSFDAKLN